MSVNVAAYVEYKDGETGKWILASDHPISSRLKYIIKDYGKNPSVDWNDLSDGLKEKYKKSDDGEVYATFHVTTVPEIEGKIESELNRTFTKVNMVISALGCSPMHDDSGSDIMDYDDFCGEDGNKDVLTVPIRKALVDDLQYALTSAREIGQMETIDMIIDEYVQYGSENRIVLVVC